LKPTSAKDLYKKTAEQLNLPEEYVRDLVEFYYKQNREKMAEVSYTHFNLGFGKIVIKPLIFFRRELRLGDILSEYTSRRDDRGIMIRMELQRRYDNFRRAKEMIEEFHNKIIKSRYARKIKNNLEKQT